MLLELKIDIAANRVGRSVLISSKLIEHPLSRYIFVSSAVIIKLEPEVKAIRF